MGRKKISDSNPKKGEREVGKRTVDRIVARPTFEYYDKPQIGAEFYIFRDKGEAIEGVIIGRAIANVRRNSSYPIQLDDGRVVEVFANKTLHRQLKECLFQRIRIVYIGREHTTWGHAKKIYRVYKIPHGGISLNDLKAKYGKGKKGV